MLPLLAGLGREPPGRRGSSSTTAPAAATSALDFATIGSGSPFAENTLRLGFRDDLDLEAALDLAALALYEAGDNDPSTGGPDFVRRLYPMMVLVDAQGFRELAGRRRRARFRSINERRTESGGLAGGTLR